MDLKRFIEGDSLNKGKYHKKMNEVKKGPFNYTAILLVCIVPFLIISNFYYEKLLLFFLK